MTTWITCIIVFSSSIFAVISTASRKHSSIFCMTYGIPWRQKTAIQNQNLKLISKSRLVEVQMILINLRKRRKIMLLKLSPTRPINASIRSWWPCSLFWINLGGYLHFCSFRYDPKNILESRPPFLFLCWLSPRHRKVAASAPDVRACHTSPCSVCHSYSNVTTPIVWKSVLVLINDYIYFSVSLVKKNWVWVSVASSPSFIPVPVPLWCFQVATFLQRWKCSLNWIPCRGKCPYI